MKKLYGMQLHRRLKCSLLKTEKNNYYLKKGEKLEVEGVGRHCHC